MNKNVTIYVLVLIMFLIGAAYAGEQEKEHASVNAAVKVIENIYRLFLKMTLPSSLDNVYEASTPEVIGNAYLGEMFKMAGMMQVIAEEMQAGEFTNARNTFNAFSIQYNNVSKMVPEWKKYFDKKLVAEIGKDIDNNDVSKTLVDMGRLGENVCAKCHRNNKPQVWAKYYWKDFRTVNVSTPAGNMSWPAAKAIFVASSFDGATINLAEGRKGAANQSAERFTSMFSNLKNACDSCHTTERKYFVSADVVVLVDQYEIEIKAGNLTGAQILQGQIGEQCMRCHITHEGQQRMKEMMD